MIVSGCISIIQANDEICLCEWLRWVKNGLWETEDKDEWEWRKTRSRWRDCSVATSGQTTFTTVFQIPLTLLKPFFPLGWLSPGVQVLSAMRLGCLCLYLHETVNCPRVELVCAALCYSPSVLHIVGVQSTFLNEWVDEWLNWSKNVWTFCYLFLKWYPVYVW